MKNKFRILNWKRKTTISLLTDNAIIYIEKSQKMCKNIVRTKQEKSEIVDSCLSYKMSIFLCNRINYCLKVIIKNEQKSTL